MIVRQWFLQFSNGLIIALIAVLLLGSILCFGGGVWWFRPAMVLAAFLMVFAKLSQDLVAGKVMVLKSPMTLLGLMVLALGVVQLAPLPSSLARRLSPVAHEVYTNGVMPDQARSDDPTASLPEPPQVRSPATLDRSATLRWLVGAAACLGVFWTVSHFTDRLRRLYLVWGLMIAGFLINATLAVVQVTNGSSGLYGAIVPGSGPAWAPSHEDLLETPGTSYLRNLPPPKPGERDGARAVLVPARPFLFGTLMGGRGAFLAMGMMAIPLATAIVLHLVSPRGSREPFAYRLGRSGQGSLVLLLVLLLVLSTFVTGLVAASWQCLPLVAGLVTISVPALIRPGSRWAALGLSVLLLAGLGLGVTLQGLWPGLLGGQTSAPPPDFEATRAVLVRNREGHPSISPGGCGAGYFRNDSSLFQEPRLRQHDLDQQPVSVGGGVWRRGILHSGDGIDLVPRSASWKPEAGGNHGPFARSWLDWAALSFSLFAIIHWTVELTAVAISASALGGTCNRWLAGGTDLFVDRG